MKTITAVAMLLASCELMGCAAGGSTGCTTYTAFSVSPGMAVADHSAAAPGNQQKFTASEMDAGTGTGCILTAHGILVQPDWASSDPLNVSISSAKDATNGIATCTGMTGSTVTLTATSPGKTTPQSVSVQMTCK